MDDFLTPYPFHDEKPQGQPSSEADHRHESREANVPLIALFAVLFVFTGLVIHVLLYWQINVYYHHPEWPARAESPLALVPQKPPKPWVESTPTENYQAFLRSEQETLRSYGWVDRQRGIVRIPIEQAKEMLLQRGVPTR